MPVMHVTPDCLPVNLEGKKKKRKKEKRKEREEISK